MHRSQFRLLWLVILALFVAVVSVAFASTLYGLFVGQYPLRAGYFPFLGLGWLFVMVLFAVFAVRLGSRPWRYRRFDPAMHLLRARYARGEISKDQFMQMAQDLRDSRYDR